jgi:hypothetical protein
VPTFYGETGTNFIPDEISIFARFVWSDPANPNLPPEYDFFTLNIQSSGQTLSDLCDWTVLSIEDDMTGTTKKYEVKNYDYYERTNFYIPSTLAGLEYLSDEC